VMLDWININLSTRNSQLAVATNALRAAKRCNTFWQWSKLNVLHI